MTETMDFPGCPVPFNVSALADALERRLVSIFSEFRLTTQNPDAEPAGEADQVTVYLWSVGHRERDISDREVAPRFPLVVVRPRRWRDEEGEQGARRTTVDVDFMIGVRRLNADGGRDVAAVAERIRTNLLRDPIIEKRSRMELPLESEVGEEDSFPQWVGVVSARFTIPQPVEESAI